MKTVTTKAALSALSDELKQQKKVIGFVPTMGALHEGHLSLIENARRHADTVICSIFVNPTQFNDPADLEKYPRTVESDTLKLESAGCDVLFLPSVEEMYSQGETWRLELGYLENILEGRLRPGHFQGVTQVVKKLFDIVRPDVAFFGQKDFQQVLVLKKMIELLHIPVRLVMCPIIREKDGLAMSSRNVRLSSEERRHALALSESLYLAKEHFEEMGFAELKAEALSFLEQQEGIEPDYFEICDAATLLPAESKEAERVVALVAARVGHIRLIDNMFLK